jgi:hypothetical protein
MTTYYKATRLDGTDFTTGIIDYGAALASGEVVRHPTKRKVRDDPRTYLSVSVAPADCTGFSWPCRLFRVEPVGRVMVKLSASPNKRAVSALRVVEELPAHMALGPNGEAVAAFIEKCRSMTPDEAQRLGTAKAAARVAAWDAAWYAAGGAAWYAAGAAAGGAAYLAAGAAAGAAAGGAAGGAAGALIVRDLITDEQFATLTRPFVDAGLGSWVEP